MDFVYQVMNGLHVGSIYALVALGYSMVYGIVQLINFAHGDLIVVGSYAAYVVLVMLDLPLYLAVLGSIVVCVVTALLMERIAYPAAVEPRGRAYFAFDHGHRREHFFCKTWRS